MEQPLAPDGCSRLADLPTDVEVTVVRAPQRRLVRTRVRIRAVVGLAMVLAGAAAIVSAVRDGSMDANTTPPAAPADAAAQPLSPQQSAIAAVYRYPFGCLGASPSARESAFASRAGPCWRYGVFVTGVLAQLHGTWGLALEVVSPTCPAVSLPAAVRAHVVACRR